LLLLHPPPTALDLSEDAFALLEWIACAVAAVESHVLCNDTKETGLRNTFNSGHFIGYAIEATLTLRLLHVECVVTHKIKEAEITRNVGSFDQSHPDRISESIGDTR